MDVREVLPTLDVPTLVLHRTDDRIVPVEYGREVAAAIPGARIVELTGDDHFAYAGDVDEWMDEFERFVTGSVQPRNDAPVVEHRVRIVTMGRFAVEVDGDDIPASAWGSRRARQLCKRLVAARGWPVTRDELIDMLWPDEADMAKLSARLSVQLSGVRRILGGGVIADRQSVRLDLDEVSTDLEAFHQATDDAAIVAAYTGEFLPEDRYDDWTSGVRDEARSRFVAAARRLAHRSTEAGDHLRAATLARRLIEVDRYDEDAHRHLVDSLTAAGQPGDARRAHESWATGHGRTRHRDPRLPDPLGPPSPFEGDQHDDTRRPRAASTSVPLSRGTAKEQSDEAGGFLATDELAMRVTPSGRATKQGDSLRRMSSQCA